MRPLPSSHSRQRRPKAPGSPAWGTTRLRRNRGELINASNYLHLAEGDRARAQAAHYAAVDQKIRAGGGGKLDPQVYKGAHNAAAAVLAMATGTPSVEPDTIPAGKNAKGEMTYMSNPRAGSKTVDMSRAHPALKGANAETLGGIQAEAGNIFIANVASGMSENDAAQLAVQAYEGKHQTHDEGGKKVANFLINRAAGYGKVWIPAANKYRVFRMTQTGADLALSGGTLPSFEEMKAVGNQGGDEDTGLGSDIDQDEATEEAG
jgi:hypothetical protein